MESLAQLLKSKLKYNAAYEPDDITAEQGRILRARRLHDYYAFDQEKVKQYVKTAMLKTFDDRTIDAMQFPLYNLTRKVIHSLAVAYIEPAVRYIVVPSATKIEGTETTKIVDPKAKKDNDLFQRILAESNINAAAKEWNRLAKLHDTVYVGVIYRDGRIEFEVLPPHAVTVRVSKDNYLEPDLVQYQRSFGGETHTIEWTATEHKILDKSGAIVPELNPWNGENRYGLIPWLPCRLSVPNTHWGDGDEELVDINEKVDILIASMYYNALMQSHSQAVSINMKLDDPDKKRITGPNAVIEANDVSKDEVAPDFKFVSPDPSTDANIKAIDWMLKQAAMMKGLSAASLSIDPNEASGVSKTVDLAELRERRQDDIEYLRPFEKRLFDVTRTVWNTNENEQISDEAVFSVDFVEPELPMSATEDLAIKEKRMAMGLYSPVMDMVDEDEGIDEAQALAYIIKNVQWNKQIEDAKTNAR
jgi:hypothetical protein